ncbi:hypothetical protein BC828DRAFT_378595 [Blastocladiella britannica]|nr:hypothetical protein BC828DRAFT_378595 [Blastocladiella britannica]
MTRHVFYLVAAALLVLVLGVVHATAQQDENARRPIASTNMFDRIMHMYRDRLARAVDPDSTPANAAAASKADSPPPAAPVIKNAHVTKTTTVTRTVTVTAKAPAPASCTYHDLEDPSLGFAQFDLPTADDERPLASDRNLHHQHHRVLADVAARASAHHISKRSIEGGEHAAQFLQEIEDGAEEALLALADLFDADALFSKRDALLAEGLEDLEDV